MYKIPKKHKIGDVYVLNKEHFVIVDIKENIIFYTINYDNTELIVCRAGKDTFEEKMKSYGYIKQ